MKYLKHLFIFLPCAMLLAACDHVAQDDRLIYVPMPQVQRTVLIEDFTGQRCVNCPTATAEIERIKEAYGNDKVIAVSIHAGPFSRSMLGKRYALGTDEGDAYFAAWAPDHQPVGTVNRRGLSDYPAWNAAVREQVQLTSPIDMDLQVTWNDDATTATVTTSMLCTTGTATAKLQLWLVEDGVTAFQLMPDGSTNSDYLHHHVLRAALNGTWGQDVTLPEGQSVTVACDVPPASHSNVADAGHLTVVAFVYDNDGVLQAIEAPLSP